MCFPFTQLSNQQPLPALSFCISLYHPAFIFSVLVSYSKQIHEFDYCNSHYCIGAPQMVFAQRSLELLLQCSAENWRYHLAGFSRSTITACAMNVRVEKACS